MVTIKRDELKDDDLNFCSSCGKGGEYNEQEELCDFCFSVKNNTGSGGSIAVTDDENNGDEFVAGYDMPTEAFAEELEEEYEEILEASLDEEETEESQVELEEGLQRQSAGIKDEISGELSTKEDDELTQEYQKWIDQAVEVTGKPSVPDIEWAEDDEIHVADINEDEVLGDYLENKEKDDSGYDNIFVHVSEIAKTFVYKLTAKHEGNMSVDDVQKIQSDILCEISNAGVDLDDRQSVELFSKKFREFDERLFKEFRKNFGLLNMTVSTEIAAQGFSDVGSDVSEKNDGMKNYARYFYDMGMNVTCVSNIENEFNTKAENVYLKAPSHQWEDLWSRRQTPEEFDAYQWSSAIGFGAITGFNNMVVIDMDDCSPNFVEKTLETLGLPIDYEWVVLSGSKSGFHIYIFVGGLLDNFQNTTVIRLYPNELYAESIGKVELLIRLHSILPPSLHPTGNKYKFVNCSLPQRIPAHIEMGKVQNFISGYFDATKQRNMMTYRKQEKEPEYPALSKAAWSLTIAIVSGFIGLMLPYSLVITFIAGLNWVRITRDPQYSIERLAQTSFRIRREKWEEEQREAERAREREESRKRDEEAYAVRRQLRTEIEKMPKYSNWRNAVFARCGRACEMCGETRRLEIHHRVAFDAILRAYKINTIVKAFDCDALWNVNNGSVLCKQCHEKMESSRYRNQRS